MSDPTTPDRPTPEAPNTPATPSGATANGTATAPIDGTPNTGQQASGTKSAETEPGSAGAVAGGAAAAASSAGAVGGTADAAASPADEPADNTSTPAEMTAGGSAEGDSAGSADDTVEIATVGDGEKPADGGTQPATGDKAAEGKAAVGKAAAGKSADDKSADGKSGDGKTADGKAAGRKAAGQKRRFRIKRGPWLTAGGVVLVVAVLAVLGYVWGLGPMNRLNAERGITPPAKLGGLDRITDQEIRDQLQLSQTRERLSQINDGKQVTVEAYGSLQGDRLYMLIALRGKVDIDKTVADSGATPEQIQKVGRSTCVETGELPTQCYRGSNTLTIIAQSGNDDVTVDEVAPVAEEAFNAMK